MKKKTNGHHGYNHFFKQVSLFNAKSTQIHTRVNVTCFVWIVLMEPFVLLVLFLTNNIEQFSAKIVFLNERPQPRPGKGVTNTCQVCDRSLLDSFNFCSLGCKIVGTSKKLRKNKMLIQKDGSDGEESMNGISTGSGRNKIHSFTPSTPPPTVVNYRTVKRRKGVPHRAPMGGGIIIEY
ncbi:hypothetical protein L195_g016553 [Trifolium pratense]|uniref:PLATZ transcription factor family protein n=1 Tax=Trifolium pratense TaxID=57577 RepID=A0A2K3MRQ7_TRIPR|nr:hypothetical protein L195_g016553 [Trifolium pratense]